MGPWEWMLYVSVAVVGLCIVIFVVAAAISAVRDSERKARREETRKWDEEHREGGPRGRSLP